MTPSELEKVRKKYPISEAVARLSLGLQPEIRSEITLKKAVTKPVVAPKRIRQNPKPLMNKLESDWFQVLKIDCPHARPQAVQFRLGNGIQYRPDFIDFSSSPVTAWEVKGPHSFRGGFENLKVAASLYPEINWILVWKQDGKWQEQHVLP